MIGAKIRCLVLVECVILIITGSLRADTPSQPAWVHQIGTTQEDNATGISTDASGNIFVGGYTLGSLAGTNAGISDVFIAKYDPTGSVLWKRQAGTAKADNAYGLSADSSGNVYVCGETMGDIGKANAGGYDAFLMKYDTAGTLLWSRQLGTTGADRASRVTADSQGNVYICGYTQGSLAGPNAGTFDAFLAKYDGSGTLKWSRQIGTTGYDDGTGISADRLGNVYVGGNTRGPLGGPYLGGEYDAYLTKYDTAGNQQWVKQVGTDQWDSAGGVCADGLGNAYITGGTEGSLGGPHIGSNDDAFIMKFDASGTVLWARQFGTTTFDSGANVSVGGQGDVFIGGGTDGSLGGANAGYGDAFVAGFTPSGDLLWTRQLGTSGSDGGSVSADPFGNVYMAGFTGGSLDGPLAGSWDAYVAKYTTPEPATLSLLALGGAAVIARRRKGSSRFKVQGSAFKVNG